MEPERTVASALTTHASAGRRTSSAQAKEKLMQIEQSLGAGACSPKSDIKHMATTEEGGTSGKGVARVRTVSTRPRRKGRTKKPVKSHKNTERKRRALINEAIAGLRQLVPGCDNRKVIIPSVLQMTIGYIKELQVRLNIEPGVPIDESAGFSSTRDIFDTDSAHSLPASDGVRTRDSSVVSDMDYVSSSEEIARLRECVNIANSLMTPVQQAIFQQRCQQIGASTVHPSHHPQQPPPVHASHRTPHPEPMPLGQAFDALSVSSGGSGHHPPPSPSPTPFDMVGGGAHDIDIAVSKASAQLRRLQQLQRLQHQQLQQLQHGQNDMAVAQHLSDQQFIQQAVSMQQNHHPPAPSPVAHMDLQQLSYNIQLQQQQQQQLQQQMQQYAQRARQQPSLDDILAVTSDTISFGALHGQPPLPAPTLTPTHSAGALAQPQTPPADAWGAWQ